MTLNTSSGTTSGRKTHQQTLGQHAENLARQFLQEQGLHFLTANFRCKLGEIDLIMRSATHLVFVEVRYRRQQNYGNAASSVTRSKQHKLIKTAQYFLLRNTAARNLACRFDVIGIDYQHGEHNINWIQNAFS